MYVQFTWPSAQTVILNRPSAENSSRLSGRQRATTTLLTLAEGVN
jgi:hypothetical protein